MRPIASLQASSRSPFVQVLKTSVAAVSAWLLCTVLLHEPVPIFAAIAALLVVQPSVNQSLAKGIERSFGVILGVLVATGATLWLGHSTWVVLGTIVISLLLAWALRLTPGSTVQIPISAMLVVALGAQTPGIAAGRIVETIIGAAVGLAVNLLIVPPVLVGPAHEAVDRLAVAIAETLDFLADALRTRKTPRELDVTLTKARELRRLRDEAAEGIKRAQDSLLLNPRRGKNRHLLEADSDFLSSLTVLVTRVLGMTRALRDHYDDELHTDPIVRSIAVELERAGHDLRLLAHARNLDLRPETREPATAELPALTAPLRISLPNPQHWILIGSMMEDLRRVREEIIGEG